MPNHVRNRLIIIGQRADIEKLLETIKGEGENNFIEFNKIIPMPVELREVSCPTKILTEDEYANELIDIENRRKAKPDDWMGFSHNLTQKMHDEYMEKFGCVNWYDWANSNWNTKWGAYDQSVSEIQDDAVIGETEGELLAQVEIEYSTAWSFSYPIVEKLSEMFPTVRIEAKYADEDMGYNTGEAAFCNGVVIDDHLPEGGSPEAYKLYFELHGGEDMYVLVDGEYIYKEDMEDEPETDK